MPITEKDITESREKRVGSMSFRNLLESYFTRGYRASWYEEVENELAKRLKLQGRHLVRACLITALEVNFIKED